MKPYFRDHGYKSDNHCQVFYAMKCICPVEKTYAAHLNTVTVQAMIGFDVIICLTVMRLYVCHEMIQNPM